MDNDQLDAIKAYCEAATSQPWANQPANYPNPASVAFALRAVTDLPACVAEIRKLQAAHHECSSEIIAQHKEMRRLRKALEGIEGLKQSNFSCTGRLAREALERNSDDA